MKYFCLNKILSDPIIYQFWFKKKREKKERRCPKKTSTQIKRKSQRRQKNHWIRLNHQQCLSFTLQSTQKALQQSLSMEESSFLTKRKSKCKSEIILSFRHFQSKRKSYFVETKVFLLCSGRVKFYQLKICFCQFWFLFLIKKL